MSKKKEKGGGDDLKKVGEEAEQNSQHMTDALNNAMLRETIEKLEDQKVKLLLNIKNLVDKLTQQKQDQSDIYYYLNKKLDDNYEVIAALEDQILTEQGDRENAEKLFEKRIEDMDKESKKEVHNLQTRILDLEEKLQILKQFSSEKESLDENLKQLLDTLENERKQYRIYTEDMERKAAVDREKVKQEFEQQILQYRADIQKKVDSKLSKAVKNTRTVNECMQQELRFQSNTVQNMLKLTDSVLDKDKNLRVELSIAQSNEGEITHRLATYQRIIKQLNARIAHEEEEKSLIKSSFETLLQSKEEEAMKSRDEIVQLHAFIDKENKQLDEVWKALSETYAQVVVKKKRNNRPVNEPTDHDEVLSEVFYRLVKKNPLKFKNVLRNRARSNLSTAGSDVMSTNSSKDSLLFPKINAGRGSFNDIPASIEFSMGGDGGIGGSQQSRPSSLFHDRNHSQRNKFPGRLAAPPKVTDSDSECGSNNNSRGSPKYSLGTGVESSSVVTGIPAWDNGVVKATQEANWWLNSESADTDYIASSSVADSVTADGDGGFNIQEDSSIQIGFGEDSLASNTVAGFGGDINVLSSLCSKKPEASTNRQASVLNKKKPVCKDASAQTEGRVSVFPVGSVWNQQAPASTEASSSTLRNNGSLSSPRDLASLDRDSSLKSIERAISHRLQGVVASTPAVPPPGSNSSKNSVQNNSNSNNSNNSNSNNSNNSNSNNNNSNTWLTPQPPGLNVNNFTNSPIKTMMSNIPGYTKIGNSKESLMKKREQSRRVVHGRRVMASDGGGNTKELNYTRREVTSSENIRSGSQDSRARNGSLGARGAPAMSIYGRNSGINNGYLSDEDSQNGFSICGSSVASTLPPPLGSPGSSVSSFSVSSKPQQQLQQRTLSKKASATSTKKQSPSERTHSSGSGSGSGSAATKVVSGPESMDD